MTSGSINLINTGKGQTAPIDFKSTNPSSTNIHNSGVIEPLKKASNTTKLDKKLIS